MSSDLVMYYESTPNHETEGCVATHAHSDGVSIHNIDLLSGEQCFVSRQVIYEAFAELSGLTPAKLRKLLKADERVGELEAEVEELASRLVQWENFEVALNGAGLVVKELV